MVFGQKMRHIVLGGAFTLFGMIITLISPIVADKNIESFGTIVCEDLVIIDKNGNPKIFLNCQNFLVMSFIDSSEKQELVLYGSVDTDK